MTDRYRERWGGVPAQRDVVPVPAGPLFLWRGGQRIGALQHRTDLPPTVAREAASRGELHAFLIIDHASENGSIATGLASVRHSPRPFGAAGELVQRAQSGWDATRQRRRERRVNAERAAHSVDIENAYVIRDANGNRVEWRTISVREIRLANPRNTLLPVAIPKIAVIGNRLWTVSAFQ